MKKINPKLLQTTLTFSTRERGKVEWVVVPKATVNCYIEEKKSYTRSNSGWDLTGNHLVIFDDVEANVDIGDTVEYKGNTLTVKNVTEYLPNNVYHHTEVILL